MKVFYKVILIIGVDDLKEVVFEGVLVVVVELVEGVILLFLFEYLSNVFYLLGFEDGSIGEDVLFWCDYVVYVFIFLCMNLVVIVNVLLYDCLLKFDYVSGDVFIR